MLRDLAPEVDGHLFVAEAEADGRQSEGGIRVGFELGPNALVLGQSCGMVRLLVASERQHVGWLNGAAEEQLQQAWIAQLHLSRVRRANPVL